MRKNSSQTQAAYIYLRDHIINYSLVPGTPISDNQISRELDMSRAPVREAILLLQMDGLIQSNEGGKSTVSPIRMEDISDILHIRTALECEALILIAGSGWLAPDQEQELLTLHKQMAESGDSDSISAYYRYDSNFHTKIAEYSGSPRILEMTKRLSLQMERARWLNIALPSRKSEATREHRTILQAILDHQLDAACAAARTHLRNSEQAFQDILRDRELQKLSVSINTFFSAEQKHA